MRFLLLLLALSFLVAEDTPDVPVYVLHGKPKTEAVAAPKSATSAATVLAVRDEFIARSLALGEAALRSPAPKDPGGAAAYDHLAKCVEILKANLEGLKSLKGLQLADRKRVEFGNAMLMLSVTEQLLEAREQ